MKYTYAFLATLLLVGASAFPLSFNNNDVELNDLDRDFIDFLKLVPQEEAKRVVEEHLDDPELWKVFDYLLSDDFHKLVYAVEDLPEFHKYVLFLQAVGCNVIRELRLTHESLGMKEYIPPKHAPSQAMANFKKGGGYNGLVDDLIAILPKKEIQELHAKKVKESPAFAKFVNAVSSPKFLDIIHALYSQETTQTLLREAKANGVDFMKVSSFRRQLIGFA